MPGELVGLVLAGGGARGAYEAGALAELLPALPARERPRIVVGTSVGALNAAYTAATAHEPVDKAIAGGIELWRGIRFDQVLEPLLSLSEAARLGAYVGELLGVPGARLDSLLDPSPLAQTLSSLVNMSQIRTNIDRGDLRTAAVVATAGTSELSVVFHDGGGRHRRDLTSGIDYVQTRLTESHVLASSAIPAVFPAVRVGGDWYFDGGTRLNTPIKPALTLGARKVIVIALNSLARRRGGLSGERKPDVFDGAAQLTQAILVDPLVSDVHTLAVINELLDDDRPEKIDAHEQRTGRRRVPYIVIAPRDPDEIGMIAATVYRNHYASLPKALRAPSIALLGRLIDADASITHGELLSYLFFAREFVERLIEMGRRDARAWLSRRHDDGVWQIGQLHRR